MRTDAYRSGIAFVDLKINIAQRGIKSARACVGRGGVRSLSASRGRSIFRRAATCEENHVARALLKARRVCAQDKHGPRGAITNDANSRPDVDGSGEAIAARGQKENALDGSFLDRVDGLLQGVGIVGNAVGMNGKLVWSKVERSWVIQPFGVGRIGARRGAKNQKTCKRKQCLQHQSITKWLARGFSPGEARRHYHSGLSRLGRFILLWRVAGATHARRAVACSRKRGHDQTKFQTRAFRREPGLPKEYRGRRGPPGAPPGSFRR